MLPRSGYLLIFTLATSPTLANIIFPWIQPQCNPLQPWKCLKGQHCHNDTCIPNYDAGVHRNRSHPERRSNTVLDFRQAGTITTSDGSCGSKNGATVVCGNWPTGGCCSMYGWCGNASNYCGFGCQSGPCDDATSGEAPGVPQTKDGTCGATNGNSVCGNWPQGSCCSMYGYCGNSSAHCGQGCQSGGCYGPPAVQGPGPKPAPAAAVPGSFSIVGESGVPAMHAGLLPNGRVVFLDKVENYTQLTLPNGQYAYSSEYDPNTNTAVPLAYKTNSFCSGGAPLADGRFMSVGGNLGLPDIDPTVGNGLTGIRYLSRSSDDSQDGQDWAEPGNKLASARWYPTAQTLGDGRVWVVSGSLNGANPTIPANNNPTWEMLDSNGVSVDNTSVGMDLLVNNQPYYMYPFVHLLANGQLFVFVAKSSIVFDVGTNTTIATLGDLAGDYRTYPNTGTSILLPLSSANGYDPDVLVCGGGPYQDISAPTDASCGRVQPLTNRTWELDSMPEGRCMVEANLLPDGTALFLNGANRGAQGFGQATDPVLEALLYDPAQPLGQRWSTAANSTIPRLYHSVSLLLPDATVLVAGSNPVEMPILTSSQADPFVTEFRVERYTPPYLVGEKANLRPSALTINGNVTVPPTIHAGTMKNFILAFGLPRTTVQTVSVVLYQVGYVTHSLHMGHRMVYLDITGFTAGQLKQRLVVTPPPSGDVTPPGNYMLFVVADGVPSYARMVMVSVA